jgi:hypothetical protein
VQEQPARSCEAFTGRAGLQTRKAKTETPTPIRLKRLTVKNGNRVGPNAAKSSKGGIRISSKDDHPAAESYLSLNINEDAEAKPVKELTTPPMCERVDEPEGANEPPSPPIKKFSANKKATTWVAFLLAEKEGFEPSIRV